MFFFCIAILGSKYSNVLYRERDNSGFSSNHLDWVSHLDMLYVLDGVKYFITLSFYHFDLHIEIDDPEEIYEF